jgi:mannosyltransferase OCH1-like enzyme
MIEKKIHYVWVGPHRPPQEMMDTWAKMHGEDWLICPWKDHTGWINQAQIDARAARNEWNGVADCMRYEILYKFGGFCVDADSECVKSLGEGDFCNNDTAVACFENESARPGIIGCGFLGAPKGHPFFKACIDEVATQDPSVPAWKAVGPLLMGRMAMKTPADIKVYPARAFNPTHYSGAAAPGNHPIFAKQGWGSTKGYNSLRRLPCQCPRCWTSMLNAPWS